MVFQDLEGVGLHLGYGCPAGIVMRADVLNGG